METLYEEPTKVQKVWMIHCQCQQQLEMSFINTKWCNNPTEQSLDTIKKSSTHQDGKLWDIV